MNASINCKISLSKKIRAWLGKEGRITLTTRDLIDGKGIGVLSLISDNTDNTFRLDTSETSIQITPIEMTDEIPTNATKSHSNLFSSVSNKDEEVVNKIAAVKAPEKNKLGTAIKAKIEVPKEFESLKDAECKKWVSNMEEFVTAINEAKNKKSSIDIDESDLEAAKDRKQKMEMAVLLEQKRKEEAIDVPAWIINTMGGILIINDLEINLPPDSPLDLSNFSAKKIAASRDLKELLKMGYVKFISPEEKDAYIMKTVSESEGAIGSLDVFSRHEEAMAAIESGTSKANPVINEENAIDITESDIEEKTEEESMLINLTQNLPTVKTKTTHTNENKQSSHGNIEERPQSSRPTIKKKF